MLKTMGTVVVAALAANDEGGPPVAAITTTFRRTTGRQLWQPVDLIRPSGDDYYVVALDKAGAFQALANSAAAP
jgi:hypothetical protein